MEGQVGSKLMRVELIWEKRCNERLRLMVSNSWMFLGEAHAQVGRVEVHGRYFEAILARVLAQIRPSSRAEWLECIHQTMEAKNSLTRRCGYSPFQIAIGRHPELLGDLFFLDNVHMRIVMSMTQRTHMR